MRYTLESTLPLGAFKPRGGLFGSGGMTLHGGGGGFIEDIGNGISDAVSSVGDAVGDVLGTSGGGGGILGAVEDAGQSVANFVSDAGVSIDNAVNDYVPGGWGTVAAVAVPFVAPYAGAALGLMEAGTALTAAQAAGVAAGTSAATSAIEGRSLQDTLKGAALAGATSYGLASLGGAGEGLDDAAGAVDDLDIGKDMTTLSKDATENLAKSTEASLQENIDKVLQPQVIPSQVAPDITTADNLISELQPTDVLDFNQPIDASTRMGAQIADEPLSSEVLDFAQMAPDQPLPSYEPTAAVPTSDVPTSDFVPRSYDPMQASQEGFVLPENVAYDPMQASQEGFVYPSFQPASSIPAGIPLDAARYEDAIQFFAETPMDSGLLKPAESGWLDTFKQYGDEAWNWAKENPWTAAAALAAGGFGIAGLMGKGPLANLLGGLTGNKPSSSSSGGGGSTTKTKTTKLPTAYKYGAAGRIDPNYLLRNRINAGNVYSEATGYRPVTNMAEGGEVKHFFLGGLSDSLTKVLQPVEKAVVQPIGNAVPFLKDVAPYAGLIAAPFVPNPMIAAGIGSIASGFGQPGSGYNMKRALMGGISAYGLSNIGSGLEAAGQASANAVALPDNPSLVETIANRAENMGQGVSALLKGGDSYDTAAKAFGTRAGMGSAGMALFGGTGIGAVDESIAMQNQADAAAQQSSEDAASRQQRIDRQKQIALDAIHRYPYQYAGGGSVDDEMGMDDVIGRSTGNMQNGMFGGGMPMGYAAGGILEMLAGGGQPRFLSGGGDGMSDSIPASIDGQQEARLADGEFVIPADVVSHLGNGSSKAGAKQLYSMMDRVRKARTGNKKQGKQIKPTKFMPA